MRYCFINTVCVLSMYIFDFLISVKMNEGGSARLA
jgi:hypothetical protein